MALKDLVNEAWQLYMKILDVERTSAFLHIGIFNKDADEQYKLTNKAYSRYKRRRNALENKGLYLLEVFPNQRSQCFTSVDILSLS